MIVCGKCECRCCMFVDFVHPVAVLNVASCMTAVY